MKCRRSFPVMAKIAMPLPICGGIFEEEFIRARIQYLQFAIKKRSLTCSIAKPTSLCRNFFGCFFFPGKIDVGGSNNSQAFLPLYGLIRGSTNERSKEPRPFSRTQWMQRT